MTNTISFSQQNLRKSPTATFEFVHNTSHTDISLLQEPYTGSSGSTRIKGFPLRSRLQYNNAATPKTATLISNPNLYTEFLEDYSDSNITTTKIQLKDSIVVVINAYFEPHSLTNDHLIKLRSIFADFPSSPIILAGDFNARHGLWHDHHTNTQGNRLAEFIDERELLIHNMNTTTYESQSGTSVIDLTLSNDRAINHISRWTAISHTNTIFDHKRITFDFSTTQNVPLKIPFSTRTFNENKANWSLFKAQFDTPQFQDMCSSIDMIETTAEIDSCTDQLTRFITEAAFRSMPTKRKDPRPPRSPWWDEELSRMQVTVRLLRNRFNHETDPIERTTKYDQYKAYKNRYTRTIRKKKETSWRKFLEEAHSNNTWGNTFRLIKTITSPKCLSLPILESSAPNDHPTVIRNLMNGLFPDASTQSHQVTPTLANDIQFAVTEETIIRLISNSNSKKAPGPDNITGGMLKQIKEFIAPPLARLFTHCLELGHFPTSWKRSQLVIFAKPDKTDYSSPDSYRPITLISSLSKVFEKFILIQLQQCMEDREMLSSRQHGFTKHKSTITALHSITSAVLDNKRKHLTSLLAIDYSKAFDCADWDIIIQNMINYGFPSRLVVIIRSYLKDRSVTYTHDGLNYTKHTSRGCPQGSPLSPMLWNFVINPLLKTVIPRDVHLYAYADDLSIVCTGGTAQLLSQNVQGVLNTIAEWSTQNNLKINERKTNMIHFHETLLPTITLNDIEIKSVSRMKILGVTISNHRYNDRFNINAHINAVIEKTRKVKNLLFAFCKNTFGISTRKRQNIYKGLIRPMISYGSEIWLCSALRSHLKKLQSLEYVILRNSIKAFRTTSQACVTTLSRIEPITTFLENKQTKFRVQKGLLVLPAGTSLESHVMLNTKRSLLEAYQNTNDSFRQFFPSFPVPPHVRSNFFTTQFLTGHGHFLAYLHRFGHSRTPYCNLCSSRVHQNAHHLLLDCPEFMQERTRLELHSCVSLHELVNDKNRYNLFSSFCSHIYSHLKTRID